VDLSAHVRAGLAYRASAPVNWCPQDETVLANEQVIDGRCERCRSQVVQRELTQWFFRTTAYAQRLLDDMAQLEGHWPPEILTMQRNWIANLHDWLISRQRRWGTPIPVVHCGICGLVPVPGEELPLGLNLPAETSCPRCGGPAERDPDTMDTFVDSSWYFLRYPNPSYQDGPFDPAGIERWLPVAEYIGGREHACGHLIYARFMTKVLHDMGLLGFTEPFTRLTNQGDVITNGKAMSKTLGNLVSLQEQIATHGPDAVRVTMLFAGPPEQDIDWADVSPAAAVKWLGRVTRLLESLPANASGPPDGRLRRAVHRLTHSVTVAMDGKRFNVAIARLMELTTLLRNSDVDSVTTREGADALVVMLSCFAPLTATALGFAEGSSWPATDPQLVAEETTTCVVQVDGKVRARLEVPLTISEAELRAKALASVSVTAISRVICRPPRIVNIVTG
jgi:leucyl-tRNA synthetase